MKFEEVLPLMREGKMARMKSENDGSWWICGRQGFPATNCSEESYIPTIIRLEVDGRHSSDRFSWGISRCAIMADDWEIIE
jgi:hypothetical protein